MRWGTIALQIYLVVLGAILGASTYAVLKMKDPTPIVGNLLGGFIGASGALAGVLLTGYIHDRREERQRLLQAQPMAILLFKEISGLAARMANHHIDVHKLLQRGWIDLGDGKMTATPFPIALTIHIPDVITKNEEKLYLLGANAGVLVADLLWQARFFNSYIDRLAASDFDESEIAVTAQFSKDIYAAAVAAYKAIEALFPALTLR